MSTIHDNNVIYLLKLFVKRLTWHFYYRHGNKYYCPICEKSSKVFRKVNFDSICVSCQSLDRSRLTWLFLKQNTTFFTDCPKMLHIAPEPCFEKRFKKILGENYITGDLYNPRSMVKMDITNINSTDESYDFIYCSHVLEHIDEDQKAMKELHRVLKKGGWAILLVPVDKKRKITYEDFSITDPNLRLKHFGEEDHVRVYGIDYVDRLKNAGFDVKISDVKDLVTVEDAVSMGIDTNSAGEIYFCKKTIVLR